jgi:tetratricopeptide (TPR) repeat protein
LKKLLVLLAASVVLIVVLALVLLFEGEQQPPPATQEPEPSQDLAKPPPAPRYRPDLAWQALSEQERDRLIEKAVVEGQEEQLLELGREFHDKWHEDRRRLGTERHIEMEKLWFQGRRPRGRGDSIAKLEKILQDFPDTNRAGCAAYELGHHYLKNNALSADERLRRAEEYFRLAEERYRDSLCEFNAAAAPLARLALAVWIYKSSNPALARRLLEQVISQDGDKTDHLGQSLGEVARRLLETMPP